MNTKKTQLLLMSLNVILAIFCVLPAAAQKRRLPDKSIVGTWVMVSMRYSGESKVIECGKDYSQVKYYGPTGEYACAEIGRSKNYFAILPHEYGTYTYNNGKYTEMGRKGIFVIKGNRAYGKWYNCNDVWKKVKLPEELRREIVLRCKANEQPSARIQKMIHQYILNKKK